MSRLTPSSAVLAALGLALCAPTAAGQVPGVELPADPTTVEIPHETAISEQYQAIEAEVTEVVPTAPAPPAPAPEPAAPTPEPAPPPAATEQYHSKTFDVSVKQAQPSNVNVSIRINSPGDDGPVVQINNAGGSTAVEQVVEAGRSRPPAEPGPEPAEPPQIAPSDDSGALPDRWEWVWTSACFGGGARAAAAMPGWSWRWSCDDGAAGEDFPEDLAELVPEVPDPWSLTEQVLGAVPMPLGRSSVVPSAPAATQPEFARRARRRAPRPAPASIATSGGGGGPPLAALLAPATASVPSAVEEQVRHVVRAAAHARPGPADGSALVAPPLGDPTAVSPNALGAAASLLLGLWIAVLTTAIVLVVPRLRRRRRSGPAWRLTRVDSSRLERPG